MNEMQRKVLIAVAAVLLGMLLYPPFQIITSERVFGMGYSWLFVPPERATVDVATLFAQWLGVLIVGGIVFLAR